MKKLLILFASLTLLAPAANAQWFGKYGSIYEASEACHKWKKAGYTGPSKKPYPTRGCIHEKETKQFLGLTSLVDQEKYEKGKLVFERKVIKRFRY